MSSPTAGSTSFRTTRKSRSTTVIPRDRPARLAMPLTAETPAARKAGKRAGAINREPVSPVYFAAGGDLAADGRDIPGWSRGLHAAAGVGAPASRLPHDSGGHVLSRRQPRCHGHDCHGPTRASVRRASGAEPDDLDKLRRLLGHRAPVQSDAGSRYR